MNCSREMTEMKVRLIVPLLGTHENKVITDLLRISMPAVKIGDDYVRSVRKVWNDNGRPEDYKTVLYKMQYAHHGKRRHTEHLIMNAPSPDIKQVISGLNSIEQDLMLTQHEIARLKEFVRFLDSTDKTEKTE